VTRKVLLGCGAGASGVGALALGVLALTLGAVGSCGSDVGSSLVEHDTSSGTGTVVGEGVNVLGATAEGMALLAALGGVALLALAGLLLWLALRRSGAAPASS
jgi:hypothetical protein